MSEMAVVHAQLEAGREMNERVVARAVYALFGEAIFEALKAKGGCFEQTETDAIGPAGGRGSAAVQGRAAVCAQPYGAAQLQNFDAGAGGPGGGQVFAFVRPAVAAAGH